MIALMRSWLARGVERAVAQGAEDQAVAHQALELGAPLLTAKLLERVRLRWQATLPPPQVVEEGAIGKSRVVGVGGLVHDSLSLISFICANGMFLIAYIDAFDSAHTVLVSWSSFTSRASLSDCNVPS